MSYLSSYSSGYGAGQNAGYAAGHAAASSSQRPSGGGHLLAAIIAEEKAQQLQAEIEGLQGQILDLKGRLVSARAVREALRSALRQVAPEHPYVNNPAGTGNERLIGISDQAAASVKRWDDKV